MVKIQHIQTKITETQTKAKDLTREKIAKMEFAYRMCCVYIPKSIRISRSMCVCVRNIHCCPLVIETEITVKASCGHKFKQNDILHVLMKYICSGLNCKNLFGPKMQTMSDMRWRIHGIPNSTPYLLLAILYTIYIDLVLNEVYTTNEYPRAL